MTRCLSVQLQDAVQVSAARFAPALLLLAAALLSLNSSLAAVCTAAAVTVITPVPNEVIDSNLSFQFFTHMLGASGTILVSSGWLLRCIN